MRAARVKGGLAVLVVGVAVVIAMGGVAVIAIWTFDMSMALDDGD